MKARGKDNVTVLPRSINDMRFDDAEFDGVADLMVSQHVPYLQHRALYREYRRVLKPGGWLFLYHLTSRTTGRAGAGPEKNFPDHERLDLFPDAGFTCLPHAEALTCLLMAAGFEVKDQRGLSREYPGDAVAHYAVIEAVAI
jgi:cyclopropane fatty-acyl-phospholipid synthase-like methyltransferase